MTFRRLQLPLFVAALFTAPAACIAQMLEAPVTVAATVSVTIPKASKVSGTGVDLSGSIQKFKFTNALYLSWMAEDFGFVSTQGCKLVARWSPGDTLTDFRYFLVNSSGEEAELTDARRFAPQSISTQVTYKEHWEDEAAVSGSGAYKVATVLDWNDGYLDYVLSGITDCTYTIKPLQKGGSPYRYITGASFDLTGAMYRDGEDAVVEMTIKIGKPKVIQTPVVQPLSGVGPSQ